MNATEDRLAPSTVHLQNFVLHLADTTLILAQRLCEWCGHGPVLEQDIALSNIALDLLGESSNYYEYASTRDGEGRTADALAMLRPERDYKNLLLVEQPNGHFGDTIVRQFLFDVYHSLLLEQLTGAADAQLQAIGEKSLKEAKYHQRWSSEWMIRLGDGTEDSRRRMQLSLDRLLPYVGEFFSRADYEQSLMDAGILPDLSPMEEAWRAQVEAVLSRATLQGDLTRPFTRKGGKQGVHTEHFGYILTDLQYMQRAYPGLQW